VADTDTTRNFAVWQVSPPDYARGLVLGSRSRDTAVAVAVGSDGNVYAAGHMDMGATGPDIAVISLDTSLFSQRWFYSYDHAGGMDQARALLCGSDGNVYVAGCCFLADSAGVAFIVLSLTGGGQFRWVYADTGGHAAAFNVAGGLAEDTAGNIYACGMIAGTESTHMDAVVTSLTAGGDLRWTYRYARPDTGSDYFGSIAMGPDGNLYACGTTGDPPDCDWLVVSLTAAGAVSELRPVRAEPGLRAATFFNDHIAIRGLPPHGDGRQGLAVRLYDATGRIVAQGPLTRRTTGAEFSSPELASLPAGFYLLDLGSGRARLKTVKPR
jgi:hypothetical protein